MVSFRFELFDDPVEYEETPLRDRKQALPFIVGRVAEQRARKAEFLRDVIALANTSRMLGRPAYLLFGITDDGQIRGIEQDLSLYGQEGVLTDDKVQENVRHQFKDAIHRYISPHVSWELMFGKSESRLVAYMRIDPLTPSQPFQIKSEFRIDQERVLVPGACWIRFGESKHEVDAIEISPDDDSYNYAYSTVPYVLPSHWLRYFNAYLNQSTIRQDASISPYIEQYIESTQTLESRIFQFLNSPTERLLVIEGAATSGKSTLLNRLCYRLCLEGTAAVEEITKREEFAPPPGWIPVLLSLRTLPHPLPDTERLARVLLEAINEGAEFWTTKPAHPEKLLEKRELRWLICCDGLDEITGEDNQRRFLRSLRGLLRRYPEVRTLLTTRPYAIRESWDSWSYANLVKVQTLSEEQIEDYVGAQVSTGNELDRIMAFLRGYPDLIAICSSPGYLVATAQELIPHSNIQPQDAPTAVKGALVLTDLMEGSESTSAARKALPSLNADDLVFSEPIETLHEKRSELDNVHELPDLPRVGVVLEQVYRYLWGREVERWNLQSANGSTMWESACILAIETDGTRPVFHSEILDRHLKAPKRKVRQWLLTLGILRQPDFGLWSFCNQLVKIFFATWWIRNRLIGNDFRGARQKLSDCTETFSEKVLWLLPHVFDGDVTALLPKQSDHDHNAA